MLIFLDRCLQWINRWMMAAAGLTLAAMIVLTCGNILLRVLWRPIPGTFELMGFFGAVAAAFALSATQQVRGHIAVDVLIQRFSKPVRRRLIVLNHLVLAALFGVIAWQVGLKAHVLYRTGEVTETLRIIYYPFIGAVALGCAVLAVGFGVEALLALFDGKERCR